ncbi:putative RNA-directed DNA polymerase from transposon BS [Acropora cervicornis]|uniref:RNA-directed DNA polymerase from transposon BS n=1 Tax=Acropora cervicornis TaxID=6130 RepID=A0AAD9UX24_ACRCE|nr:putative RNA-directed DNA polymerase from transposon BS [Acropora cervicornis]
MIFRTETAKDDTILDILKSAAAPNETAPPIIKAEVKEAVRSLKDRKYPWDWTTSILIAIPKKASFNCAGQRTVALISHASKIMVKILQKRIAPTAESLLDDYQAGFRVGRGTVEQVTNLRILCENYIEHDLKVFLNFVDYRKAFDRVWHDTIWAVLRKYGIDENIMRALEQLYTKSTNKEIVSRSVEESTGGFCVQGLLVNNLRYRFPDDIALIAGNNSELQDLTNRLNTESTRLGMKISAEKSKTLVVGKTSETLRSPVKLSQKQLGQVENLKYLGCNMTRSTNEVKIRAGMAMSSFVEMDKLWKSRKISFGVKLKLLRSIVISVLLCG